MRDTIGRALSCRAGREERRDDEGRSTKIWSISRGNGQFPGGMVDFPRERVTFPGERLTFPEECEINQISEKFE